jgi:hypothetical protein
MKVVVLGTKYEVPRLRDLLTLETSFHHSTFFSRRWTFDVKKVSSPKYKIRNPVT